MKSKNTIKTIFLSSTGKDLFPYRESVFKAIQKLSGFSCVRMEDFVAADQMPLEYCVSEVYSCDIFIGIIGHYYGNSPDEIKSYTEYEYEEALKNKKPRLMFVAPEDFPVPASLRESELNYQKQKQFRSRVLKERIVSQFKTPEDLALEITTSLFNYTSRGSLNIDVDGGRCVVVVEGAQSTEVRIEDIPENGLRLTTNQGDLHLKKITILSAADFKPMILDFTEGELPHGSVFKRPGGGYYHPQLGGELRYAGENTPRFEEIEPGVTALLLEPAATNYLLDSTNPSSQWVNYIGPGKYTLWVTGDGSASLKRKDNDYEGTVSENNPYTFILEGAEPIFVKVEGRLFNFQINHGELPLSFLPTTNATLTRASDSLNITFTS